MASTAHDAIIQKIFAKTAQLKSRGLTEEDQDIIKGNRLKFIWLEATGESVPDSTKWRHFRARKHYREVQNVSSHLFLAVVLTISPNVCYTSEFKRVVSYLVGLVDYEECKFSLGFQVKELLESSAAEQGYAGSLLYLEFMRETFPEPECRRK